MALVRRRAAVPVSDRLGVDEADDWAVEQKKLVPRKFKAERKHNTYLCENLANRIARLKRHKAEAARARRGRIAHHYGLLDGSEA